MILIAKPSKVGSISNGASDVTNLLAGPSAALIDAVDFGLHGNPDGAIGSNKVFSYPDFRGGHPQGALRAKTVSGQGAIHVTNVTSAPMSK
jgi:hypothetical protein